MSESSKPDGNLADADFVSVDSDGKLYPKMEILRKSGRKCAEDDTIRNGGTDGG